MSITTPRGGSGWSPCPPPPAGCCCPRAGHATTASITASEPTATAGTVRRIERKPSTKPLPAAAGVAAAEAEADRLAEVVVRDLRRRLRDLRVRVAQRLEPVE